MSGLSSIDGRVLLGRLFRSLHIQSEAAESLLHTLCHLGAVEEVRVFVIGGLVRDLLLDEVPNLASPLDIDLAVDGDPTPIHSALANSAGARLTIHDRFGTASATLRDGTRIDVARARSERYPSPGDLPIVSPAPITVDLLRRDFTVNAIALRLGDDRCAELIAPRNAWQDLERRTIRTLHEGSFRDDPTRLVRAARYAARIGGVIERGTMADARRERHHLAALSPERFGDAWRLLLGERDACAALTFARRLKIPQSREARWSVPPSALGASEGVEHFWASIGLLSRDREIVDWLPRSVGLQRRERIALQAGVTLRLQRRSIGRTRRASRVAAILERFPEAALEAAGRVWDGASGLAIRRFLERRREIQSPISARRLQELGVEAGPSMGRWLRRVEDAIWDGELDPGKPESVARMEQRIRLSR